MSEEYQESDAEILPSSNYEGGVFTVLNLSLVTFLVFLGLSMVAPILPNYAESFQVSYTLVGFVVSSFAVTRMIFDVPAGLLTQKFEKKKIMISGLLLISTSSILAGFATNYITLVIARLLEGTGSALYVTTATVFLAQSSGTEKRGQWMSLYMGMLLLGTIIGPTFGGIIADIHDIHTPFFAYAIITGLGVIPTLTLPRLPNSGNISSPLALKGILSDIRQVLSNPSYLLVTFTFFTLFFLRTGVNSTLVPLFAASNLGLNSTSIGLVFTISGIAIALVIIPVGRISDRIGRKNPLVLCLILTAVITVIIPFSIDMLTLSVAMAIYGAVVGIAGPSAAYVTDVSPQDKLELSMGFYRVITDFGSFVGPLLLGFLADITATPAVGEPHSGLIGVFPFAASTIILIAAFLLLLKAEDPVKERIRFQQNKQVSDIRQ
ncbi:MAG: MFS transporter [Candidatus Thorarchaeota archaeon]